MSKFLKKIRKSSQSANRVFDVMETLSIKEALTAIVTIAAAMIVFPSILLILMTPPPLA